MVLSIVFRKNASAKMKICAGKPGEWAAKRHLVAWLHIPAALSRVLLQRHSSEWPVTATQTLDSVDGICYFSVVYSTSMVVRYFIHRYRLDPHSFPDTYCNLAQTSISADFPSGKVPTTRVRLRISRFMRSMTCGFWTLENQWKKITHRNNVGIDQLTILWYNYKNLLTLQLTIML